MAWGLKERARGRASEREREEMSFEGRGATRKGSLRRHARAFLILNDPLTRGSLVMGGLIGGLRGDSSWGGQSAAVGDGAATVGPPRSPALPGESDARPGIRRIAWQFSSRSVTATGPTSFIQASRPVRWQYAVRHVIMPSVALHGVVGRVSLR